MWPTAGPRGGNWSEACPQEGRSSSLVSSFTPSGASCPAPTLHVCLLVLGKEGSLHQGKELRVAGDTEARRRRGVQGECGRGRSRPTVYGTIRRVAPLRCLHPAVAQQDAKCSGRRALSGPSYTRELRPSCPAGKWQEPSELQAGRSQADSFCHGTPCPGGNLRAAPVGDAAQTGAATCSGSLRKAGPEPSETLASPGLWEDRLNGEGLCAALCCVRRRARGTSRSAA